MVEKRLYDEAAKPEAATKNILTLKPLWSTIFWICVSLSWILCLKKSVDTLIESRGGFCQPREIAYVADRNQMFDVFVNIERPELPPKIFEFGASRGRACDRMINLTHGVEISVE